MLTFIICHVWEAPNSSLTLAHHIIPVSSSQGIMYCVVLHIIHGSLHLLLMILLALHYTIAHPKCYMVQHFVCVYIFPKIQHKGVNHVYNKTMFIL